MTILMYALLAVAYGLSVWSLRRQLMYRGGEGAHLDRLAANEPTGVRLLSNRARRLAA